LKTKELTELLKSDPLYKFESHHTELIEWPVSESEKEDEDSKAKKRKLNEYNSSNNMNIRDLKFPLHGINNKISPRVKTEVGEMINYLNSVRLWIQLNVPRIEDGNNFGVQVQEEMIDGITKAEENALTSLHSISKYHATRAKMVSKYLKYPGVDDYKECIIALDMQYYGSMITSIRDIRNHYAILYDSILKNFEKIVKPRSSHTSAMF